MVVATLPAELHKDRILNAIENNLVTLIQGATGSGKSTIVPQLLCDLSNDTRVVCTQPRRLATFLVAKRVSSLRGDQHLGGEVGYEYAQHQMSTKDTRILFATSGIFLHWLVNDPESMINSYDYWIFDEVHERSSDNDIVLAIAKALLNYHTGHRRTANANGNGHPNRARARFFPRIVLMSATLETGRYSQYFKLEEELGKADALGATRVFGFLSIDNQDNISTGLPHQVSVFDLDQIGKLLRSEDVYDPPEADIEARLEQLSLTRAKSAKHKTDISRLPNNTDDLLYAVEAMYRNRLTDGGGIDAIPDEILLLVRRLIRMTVREEVLGGWQEDDAEDTERKRRKVFAILVFLPDYKTIERQWNLLEKFADVDVPENIHRKIYALHGQLEFESCSEWAAANSLDTVEIILATSVAESSITIPNLVSVIDLGLDKNVSFRWAGDSQLLHEHRLSLCSEAQCRQRQGRAGRTCDGTVYRLVPNGVYQHHMIQYQTPSLQKDALLDQTLLLISSTEKVISERILDSCLDPPSFESRQCAIEALLRINAIERWKRGHALTSKGELLAKLPLSVISGLTLLEGAKQGYLREAAILAALEQVASPINCSPTNPSLHEFTFEFYGLGEFASVLTHANDVARKCCQMLAYDYWNLTFLDRLRRTMTLKPKKERDGKDIAETGETEETMQFHRFDSSTTETSGDRVQGVRERFRQRRANNSASGLKGQADEIEDGDDRTRELWYYEHNVSRSALWQISELVDDIYERLYALRPKFLLWNTLIPRIYLHTDIKAGRTGVYPSVIPPMTEAAVKPRLLYPGYLDDFGRTLAKQRLNGVGFDVIRVRQGHGEFSARANSRTTLSPATPSSQSPVATEPTSAPPHAARCIFFSSPNGCRNGNECMFRHQLDATGPPFPTNPSVTCRSPILCRFVNAPEGCPYGTRCFYYHPPARRLHSKRFVPAVDANSVTEGLPGPSESDDEDYATSPDAPFTTLKIPVQGLYSPSWSVECRSWMKKDSAWGEKHASPLAIGISSKLAGSRSVSMLLIGEGDFSFGTSLVRHHGWRAYPGNSSAGRRLAVSTLQSKETVISVHGRAQEMLDRLTEGGVPVLYDMNALDPEQLDFIRGFDVVTWNFPYFTKDDDPNLLSTALRGNEELGRLEDSIDQHVLVGKLFGNLSAAPDCEIHLTLCQAQFARWKILSMARRHFYFLLETHPFDLNDYPEYQPVQSFRDAPFAMENPMTYVFRRFFPSALLNVEEC